MSSRLALSAVFVIAFVGGILMGMLGLHAARESARREGYAAAVDSVRAAATAALEADTLITGWTSKDTTQTFIVVPVRVGRALVSR